MYPPRKNIQGISKSKTNNIGYNIEFQNDFQKDGNKILQNVPKYQQLRDQKRDFMVQGIINLKKKEFYPQLTSMKNKNGDKSGHVIGRESDYDERLKEKCRRIERKEGEKKEGENKFEEIMEQKINFIQNMNIQIKKVQSEGHLPKNNVYTVHQQQNYQIDGPKSLMHNFHSQHSINYKQINEWSDNYHRQPIQQKPTINKFHVGKSNNTYAQIDNNRYNNNPTIRQYNSPVAQSHSKKYGSNLITQSKTDLPLYVIPTESNYLKEAQQTQMLIQSKKDNIIQFKNQKKINNMITNNVNNTSLVKNRTHEQSPPPFQNIKQYVQPSNNCKIILQKTQQSTNLQIGLQKVQTTNKPNSIDVQSINNEKNQQYISKIEESEIKNQQKDLMKQLNQMRNKFNKSEQQKIELCQKLKVVQNENNSLQAENQQIKLKLKNIQFEVNNLQNYKQRSENQIKDLKQNKDIMCNDFIGKINQINQVNQELRKKVNEIGKLDRNCLSLEQQLNQKKNELNQMREASKIKQEKIELLTSKQSQFSKLSLVQNKTEAELKICKDKNALMLQQNNLMKQQITVLPKLQAELTKYKKQIQQMLENMKDLEQQLSQKDRLFEQYKSFSENSAKINESTRVKLIEQQLELVMKQKIEQIRRYEQKLLEKDKQIEQIESQCCEQSTNSQLKLGGLQAGEAPFQQILKQQLQQINNLKKQNSAKIKELFNAKIQLQSIKCEIQNEVNRNKVLSLQLESGQINAHNISESHLRAARNEVESLNKRIDSMNSTLESKKREIKNKDEFIKQYLISTNKNNDVGFLLSQLERILTNKL